MKSLSITGSNNGLSDDVDTQVRRNSLLSSMVGLEFGGGRRVCAGLGEDDHDENKP